MPVYHDKKRNTYYISASYTVRKGVYKKLVRRGFKRKKDAMKHKKDLKHKLAEVIYRKPSLGKKVAAIEKSMKEVNKLINDTK